MQDRPTAEELLSAVERFLEDTVVAALDGPARFHARVAANVLRIVMREMELEAGILREEWARLGRLLGDDTRPPESAAALREAILERTRRLCERIRSGDAREGPWRREVLDHVRRTVEDKLRVANPKVLTRKRA